MKSRIYFLPFAGGSSYSYTNFASILPKHLEFRSLEVPGRGTRINDALLKNAHELCDDFFAQLQEDGAFDKPYILFGHSMGALLGFLLLHKIKEENLPLPQHFYASGRGGPSFPDEREQYYLLSDLDFKQKLKELGGSPKEVLEHDTLMDFFLPILRADFELVETYNYTQKEPLNIPITVFIGDKDEATFEEAQAWQEESTQKVQIHVLPGDHFFLFEQASAICSIFDKRAK